MLKQVIKALAAIRAHNVGRPLLCFQPNGIGRLDHVATLVGQMQAASTPARRRVHRNHFECEKALEVARQCRLFDVERMPNLNCRNAIARCKLRQQSELARRDTVGPHSVIVDACYNSAQLPDPGRKTRRGRTVGNVTEFFCWRLRSYLMRARHHVHRHGPPPVAVIYGT